MSNYCVQCSMPIPGSQTVCSMCYGDIAYGSDGYYRDWAEQQLEAQEEWEVNQDEEFDEDDLIEDEYDRFSRFHTDVEDAA